MLLAPAYRDILNHPLKNNKLDNQDPFKMDESTYIEETKDLEIN
jgi:hypothetical protein